MTLHDLYLKGELSLKAYSFCADYNFVTLLDLKQHFNSYKRFKYSTNVINTELVKLCNTHFDFAGLLNQDEFLNIIDALDQRRKKIIDSYIKHDMLLLSNRSKNAVALQVENDCDLDGFTEYIFSSANFSVLKMINVGKNSLPEIEAFLDRLKQFILEVAAATDEILCILYDKYTPRDTIPEIPIILSDTQAQLINDFIAFIIQKLSCRSKNALIKYLENDMNIFAFSNKIFIKNFKSINIPNVGTLSMTELDKVFTTIKLFCDSVANINDESKLYEFKYKALRRKLQIPDSIASLNSIFKITDALLYQNILFSNQQTTIFKRTLNIDTLAAANYRFDLYK